jgi:hypothetical protein
MACFRENFTFSTFCMYIICYVWDIIVIFYWQGCVFNLTWLMELALF